MKLTRRDFLAATAAGGLSLGWPRVGSADAFDEIETLLQEMADDPAHYPGIAACVIREGKVAWSKGVGLANIAKGSPMTTDTIQNIGSVSKTITATAVMQLVEAGQCALDDPIDTYLPFAVRVPRHPDAPITFRHLLTHTAGIADAASYDDSYSCGDPGIDLETWIRGYLLPDGEWYHPRRNFHSRAPGERNSYSNVGYGLLGLLVQEIAMKPFDEYCTDHIFQPLDMTNTGWMLRDVATENHAILYLSSEDGERADARKLQASPATDALSSLCLYSFPNYPDGLLRTSAKELALFIAAYLKGSRGEDTAILKADSVKQMLTVQTGGTSEGEQGLCWVAQETSRGMMWAHSGGDPGVATFAGFLPESNAGILFFTNGPADQRFSDIIQQLLDHAGESA